MKSNLRWMLITGMTLFAGVVNAEDRMPWVADFNTACGMAAEQRRLVLLHFYNDNCGPCVRVEQNVFSRPEVADAVSQNYVAVKVHAGKNPQLASKYHVNQWPTDVFVTASGLEVFRTVSPQKPTDYVAVLNQVATHSGVGSARLANNPANANPTNIVAQASSKTQGAFSAAAAALSGVFTSTEQRVQQTTTDAQRAAAEAQQKWNATSQQAQNAVNQGQASATSIYQQANTAVTQGEQQVAAAGQQAATSASTAVQQAEQQATAAVQQATNTAQQWENQATSAVQGYERQATAAYQQAHDRALQVGQQVEQQADATKQQWQATASQTAQEVNTAAQNLKQQASSLLDRRSAFVPVETSPAAAAIAPTASSVQAAPQTTPPAPTAPAAATAVAAGNPPVVATSAPALPQVETAPAANSPPNVTSNPYVTSRPAPAPQAPSSPPANSAPSLAQAYTNATAAATSAAPVAVQASAILPAQQPQPPSIAPANGPANGSHQLVPVSQAPPLGLDGFCPVTLVETMSKNSGDRNAWKKGDRRFGAIHKGRTYLFTSADNQQRFLQNPDGYAPVLSGCDPVLYTERGQMVDGKRAFGLVTSDKHIYLFADEASRNRFEKSPAGYVGALQQAMARNNQSASIYR
jgi:YHS domain-containing protein/thiol-disulfide isomerase/thioredoxin